MRFTSSTASHLIRAHDNRARPGVPQSRLVEESARLAGGGGVQPNGLPIDTTARGGNTWDQRAHAELHPLLLQPHHGNKSGAQFFNPRTWHQSMDLGGHISSSACPE
jgi:hypothetical protein